MRERERERFVYVCVCAHVREREMDGTKSHKSHMILHSGNKSEKAQEEGGKIEEAHIIFPADRQTPLRVMD